MNARPTVPLNAPPAAAPATFGEITARIDREADLHIRKLECRALAESFTGAVARHLADVPAEAKGPAEILLRDAIEKAVAAYADARARGGASTLAYVCADVLASITAHTRRETAGQDGAGAGAGNDGEAQPGARP